MVYNAKEIKVKIQVTVFTFLWYLFNILVWFSLEIEGFRVQGIHVLGKEIT